MTAIWKTMLIGGYPDTVESNYMSVDIWKVEYQSDETEDKLVEIFYGQTEIEMTDKQKYLAFFLSSKGDNMVNVEEKQKKSVWVSNKICNRLYNLNLKQYFFECAMIFHNVILRNSILYGSETYHNLKEKELRTLECMEEKFLRQILKSGRGAPFLSYN